MVIYLLLQIGVLGVIGAPWRTPAASRPPRSPPCGASRNLGQGAADMVTVLILITAFGSVFAGLLGGSRVPYDAARGRRLLPAVRPAAPAAPLPARGPDRAWASITAIGSSSRSPPDPRPLLTAVIVIVQAIAQVVALTVLRRREPGLRGRTAVALSAAEPGRAGRLDLRLLLGRPGADRLVDRVIVAGVVAFLVWARVDRGSGRSGRKSPGRPVRLRSRNVPGTVAA